MVGVSSSSLSFSRRAARRAVVSPTESASTPAETRFWSLITAVAAARFCFSFAWRYCKTSSVEWFSTSSLYWLVI